MNTLRLSHSTVQLLMEMALALFFAILFLQSGADKIVDRRGNQSYLQGVFAKSPLKPYVPQLLWALTALELVTGIMSALGFLQLLFAHQSVLALWGAVLATLSFLALFFGQRMAKDYAGAAGLVPYFLVAMLGLYVLR